MKTKKTRNILFPIILILLIILSLADLSRGQGEGDKAPASQILRKNTLDSTRFTIALQNLISWKGSNNRPTSADTAYALALASITNSNQLSETFRDSLYNFLIDSCDFARYLGKNALNDSSQISDAFKNILQNSFINKVNEAISADYSDSSGTSAHATISDYALSAPIQAVCSLAIYATNAGNAVYALSAGSVGHDTAGVAWYDLDATTQDSILIAYLIKIGTTPAKYADSLTANAIDDYGMFTNTIKSTYLPTANEKSAMAKSGYSGVSPSGTNKYMDSSAAIKHFVFTGNDTLHNLTLQMTGGTHVAGYGISVDTVRKIIFVGRGTAGSDSFILDDSASTYAAISAVTSAMQANFYDYNGAGGSSYNIAFSNGTPSGGSPTIGDIKFDSTYTGNFARFYVYDGTNWLRQDTTGSGGGGTPSQVTTTIVTSPVSTDSFVYRHANNQSFSADTAFISPHYVKVDTVYPLTHLTGVFGAHDRKFAIGWWRGIRTDSLLGGGTNHATDTLYIKTGNLFFGSGTDLGSVSSGNSLGNVNMTGSINFNQTGSTYAYITGVGNTSGINITGIFSISPFSNLANDLGSSTNRWDSVYADDYLANTAFRAGEGASYTKMDASGNFTATGAITGGSVNATGNITTTTGDLVGNKNYFLNSATPRYGISENQWYAMDDACSPNDSNEFITRVALTTAFKHILTIDSGDSLRQALPHYPRSFVSYILRHIPSCQSRDSLGLSVDPDYYNSGSLELSPAYLDTMCWRDTTSDGNTWGWRNSVGFVEVDTSSRRTGMTLNRNWDDPRMSGTYYVSENGSDTLGEVTGYFRTIQGAVNKVPYVRVRVNNSALQDATTGGTYGKHGFNPRNASASSDATYKGLIYMGNYLADTVKVNKIPDFFRVSGAWACTDSISGTYAAGTARTKVWHMIDRWANDSIYVFPDTQAYRPGTEQVFVRIARPWTIRVLPPKNGAAIVVSSPIDIPSYAPITIEGIGEKQTVLVNTSTGFSDSTQPTNTTIFRHNSAGSVFRGNPVVSADSMAGLPITIKDMTIITRAGSTTTQAPLMLGGKVKLENLTIIAAGASGAACVVDYKGLNVALFGAGNNSLLAQNVTIVADSDQAIYKVESPLSFESRESSYSYKGNGGRVLYSTYDLGAYHPTFYNDEIYADSVTQTVPTYAFEATTAQTTKLKVLKCEFIGRSEKYDGTLFTGNAYSTSYNLYDNTIATPPIKVRDQQAIFQTKKIAPK